MSYKVPIVNALGNYFAWFYALGAGFTNAIAHFVFPVIVGGYFPGLYTAPLHLIMSITLVVALIRENKRVREYHLQTEAVTADDPPFLFDGDLDGRLLPKERVATVTIGDTDAAFPFSVLAAERVVHYTVASQDLVVFFKPGTLSAFVDLLVGGPAEVGATGVFDPNLDGQELTFRAGGETFVDTETGSVWNILGEATQGPLAGSKLRPIIHGNHFWFAWGPSNRIPRSSRRPASPP